MCVFDLFLQNIKAQEQRILGGPEHGKFLGSQEGILAPHNRSPRVAKTGKKGEWCKRTGCWKYTQQKKASNKAFIVWACKAYKALQGWLKPYKAS